MANYGVKVSQSGYDVKTCADKNLIYSSKFANAFKIAKEGATTLAVNDSATSTKTIAHGLGYTPSHLVFVDLLRLGTTKWASDGRYQIPFYDPDTADSSDSMLGDMSSFTSYSNGTNVYVEITNGSGGNLTYNIYYYIFIETNG